MTVPTMQNNDNYTHFAVWKPTGKIVNGWDYSEYDPEELRRFKKDYFTVDLEDYGIDPKQCRILNDRSLRRMGLDPDDNSNWGEPVMGEGRRRSFDRIVNEAVDRVMRKLLR